MWQIGPSHAFLSLQVPCWGCQYIRKSPEVDNRREKTIRRGRTCPGRHQLIGVPLVGSHGKPSSAPWIPRMSYGLRWRNFILWSLKQCSNWIRTESHDLADGPALLSGEECFVISVPSICKSVCLQCWRAPVPASNISKFVHREVAFALVICTFSEDSPVDER